MNALRERRNTGRQGCRCEVCWSFFNKESNLNGHLLNFSQGGGYLETAWPITPRTTVLIRVLQCANCVHEHPKELRFNAIAEVKWCRELSTNEKIHYGIGVQYHIPG